MRCIWSGGKSGYASAGVFSFATEKIGQLQIKQAYLYKGTIHIYSILTDQQDVFEFFV